MNIRKKMIFVVLGVSISLYVIALGYASYNMRQNSIYDAKQLIESVAMHKSNEIKANLDDFMSSIRAMAVVVEGYLDYPPDQRTKMQQDMLFGVLSQYDIFESTWMSWELSTIDDNWDRGYGRERTICYFEGLEKKITIETLNTDGDVIGGLYHTVKVNKRETISAPYIYEDYDLNSSREILGTSPIVPILSSTGDYLGQVGCDLSLDDFRSMIKFEEFDEGYAFLAAYDGTIVAHPVEKFINTSIDELSINDSLDSTLLQRIHDLNFESLTVTDSIVEGRAFVALSPLYIGRSDKPWVVGTVVPYDTITQPFRRTVIGTVIVGIVGIVVLLLVVYSYSNQITVAIERTHRVLRKLSWGELDTDELEVDGKNNELSQMQTLLNKLISDLRKKTLFAKEIGAGKMDSDFQPSSQYDELGLALVKMRDNLNSVIEDTKVVVVEAGENGKLSVRIDAGNKEGAWEQLSDAINNLIESFYKPLMRFNKVFSAMAVGDMTLRYSENVKGDIKVMAENLNVALDNMDYLIHQISQNAGKVDDSAEDMKSSSNEMSLSTKEIASAIAQMSHGAQTQVSKVDESSNLIEVILSSSTEMATKAENINNAAKLGLSSSEKGMEMVNKVIFNMSDISSFSDQTNDSINVLAERSNEITRVLSVITEIASQTNLLALNAAIEAAQAGDAGRGFAVVAEEIRKLAEDSRKSAQEIEKLVGDVQTDTNSATHTIKTMIRSVRSGEDTTKEAAKVFEDILKASGETLGSSEEILNAAKGQTEEINNVVAIIEGVVVIAEQTAAGTEEIASSANELSSGMESYYDKSQKLSEIARSLKDGVSILKLSGDESVKPKQIIENPDEALDQTDLDFIDQYQSDDDGT